MKTLLTSISLLLVFLVSAQNSCSKYYPFNEGTTAEYTIYDKKGKADGTLKQSTTNVSESNGITTAEVNSELLDKKGESIIANKFNIRCDGENFIMDFESLMNGKMMSQFKDGDVKVTGTNVELPNELSEGQTLSDADITITMNMAGMNMKMTNNITNRKVIGYETITTPAGTFDCVVISQDTSGKMMMANYNSTQKTWLAEGVGMVKSEDYNGKGKLQGTTELVAFSK